MIIILILTLIISLISFAYSTILSAITGTIAVVFALIVLSLIVSGNIYYVKQFVLRTSVLLFLSFVCSPCALMVALLLILLLSLLFLPILFGDGLKAFIFMIWSAISTFSKMFIPLYNMVFGMLPPINTLINMLFKILIIGFQTLAVLFCNISDLSDMKEIGFNALDSCPTIKTMLDEFPEFINRTLGVFQLMVDLTEEIAFAMEPVICLEYDPVGIMVTDCTYLCAYFNLPGSDCNSATITISWILGSTGPIPNIFRFGVNVLDITTSPWLRNLFKKLFDDIKLTEMDEAETLYDMMDIFIQDFLTEADTEYVGVSKLAIKVVLSMGIQYIFWFPDAIICYFITPSESFYCIAGDVCRFMMLPTAVLIYRLDVLRLFGNLNAIVGRMCTFPKRCPCQVCDSGLTNSPIILEPIKDYTRGPCTLGRCIGGTNVDGSNCNAEYSVMFSLVGYIQNL